MQTHRAGSTRSDHQHIANGALPLDDPRPYEPRRAGPPTNPPSTDMPPAVENALRTPQSWLNARLVQIPVRTIGLCHDLHDARPTLRSGSRAGPLAPPGACTRVRILTDGLVLPRH